MRDVFVSANSTFWMAPPGMKMIMILLSLTVTQIRGHAIHHPYRALKSDFLMLSLHPSSAAKSSLVSPQLPIPVHSICHVASFAPANSTIPCTTRILSRNMYTRVATTPYLQGTPAKFPHLVSVRSDALLIHLISGISPNPTWSACHRISSCALLP
jgi:hypothetical protein